MLTKEVLEFLDRLHKNNNREWFAENKKEFQDNEQIALPFSVVYIKGSRIRTQLKNCKFSGFIETYGSQRINRPIKNF
jgi:uncharacterized protein (DUF2461 family)